MIYYCIHPLEFTSTTENTLKYLLNFKKFVICFTLYTNRFELVVRPITVFPKSKKEPILIKFVFTCPLILDVMQRLNIFNTEIALA